MPKRKIIIIGGGPAGIKAAGQAAELGAEVVLLEKMERLGKKLNITGKGRCNITNIADITDFISHFGKTGKFLRQAFSQYFSDDLMSFFKQQGLQLVIERGGRVFPASGKATDVTKTLINWLQKKDVQIRASSPASKLLIQNKHIIGVVSNSENLFCDAVILATGGKSYPATGSTGDGYRLAKSVGHKIIPTRPALVPLETALNDIENLAGLKLKNINMRLFVNGKKQNEQFGEMEFTKFGVAGPVILTVSGKIVDEIRNKNRVEISIDLKPAFNKQKLEARILRDLSNKGKDKFSSFLRGFLPSQLVPACLAQIQISATRAVNQMNKKERMSFQNWLKDFRMEITGYRPFSEAIITAGGVDTLEVNPRTMESKIIKNLYFAGEILDINGDTGGYNLQAAFSTGWLAGISAAEGQN